MRKHSPPRSGPRAHLLPLATAVSLLLAACLGGGDTPAAEQTRPSDPPTGPGLSAPAEPPASGESTLYSYCDPSAAIAAYPNFGGQAPEVVGHLYPSGGGRDYPIIDAHTHLPTTTAEEADIQRRVGIYSAVDAVWDVNSTADVRAKYAKPYIIQFHLGEYLKGFDATKLPSILASLDGQREAGAGGIKISKDFGLSFNDSSGTRLRIDDPRLDALWERAAAEKWPVSIHVADPDAWMKQNYANSPYSKQELIQQFIRVVEAHPHTVFVAIHLLNLTDSDAELEQLGQYLDRYPNLYADTSARSQYLVSLSQSNVRAFMVKHQDKILFGTDRAEGDATTRYEEELRYWETTGPSRTYYLNGQSLGLDLPPEVLQKFYFKNALRVFCAQLPPSR